MARKLKFKVRDTLDLDNLVRVKLPKKVRLCNKKLYHNCELPIYHQLGYDENIRGIDIPQDIKLINAIKYSPKCEMPNYNSGYIIYLDKNNRYKRWFKISLWSGIIIDTLSKSHKFILYTIPRNSDIRDNSGFIPVLEGKNGLVDHIYVPVDDLSDEFIMPRSKYIKYLIMLGLSIVSLLISSIFKLWILSILLILPIAYLSVTLKRIYYIDKSK
jgi:hypothetical protein